MSESSIGPGAQGVVVFVALLSFVAVTTAAVVVVGVTPVAEAVPESPESVPEQPSDAIPGVEGTMDGPAANATVTGTVRAPDGSPAANATVALAPRPAPLFEKATPGELADVVDAETAEDLYVAETDANGSFSVDVPAGEYDVIALQESNVSAVGSVNASENATGAASVTLDIVDERPLRYDAGGARAAPGETATVSVSVYNRDAEARNLTVAFTQVPENWVVESYGGNADGVDESARAFTFAGVESGEWADAEFVVRVPENATRGERYRFEAMATAPTDGANATAVVRWEGATTVLVPANDTTPTTVTYGGGGETTGRVTDPVTTTPGESAGTPGGTAGTSGTTLTTSGPDPRTEQPLPGNDVPGFGVVVAVASALAVATVLAARRRT